MDTYGERSTTPDNLTRFHMAETAWAEPFSTELEHIFIDIFKLFLQYVHRKDKDKTQSLKKKTAH